MLEKYSYSLFVQWPADRMCTHIWPNIQKMLGITLLLNIMFTADKIGDIIVNTNEVISKILVSTIESVI